MLKFHNNNNNNCPNNFNNKLDNNQNIIMNKLSLRTEYEKGNQYADSIND